MLCILYKEKQSCKVPSSEAYGVGLATEVILSNSLLWEGLITFPTPEKSVLKWRKGSASLQLDTNKKG